MRLFTSQRKNSNMCKSKEIETLARTLFGEARGEGLKGLEAVANVIMNRCEISKNKKSFWWGNDLISICKKPYQFSCWNKDDPNKEKIENITHEDKMFSTCLRIARKALAGAIKDKTQGSTHYHHKDIEPYWAKDLIPEIEIGNHLFYKLV